MKRLLLSIIILCSLDALGQTPLNTTPRTPVSGFSPKVIWDRDLRAGKSFWLPYTNSTTPVISAIDSAGTNVQLLNNGNLAISSGLGLGFRQYVPSTVLATTYAPITGSANYIQNQTASPQTAGFYISGNGTITGLGKIGTASTLGQLSVKSGSDASKGIVVQAFSLTQSFNLMEYQASTGTVLSGVRNSGRPYSTLAPSVGDDLVRKTELDLKANLASPTFTGTPTLPTGTIAITQAATDNSTKPATTAFVQSHISNFTGWGLYQDNVYTTGSPLVLSTGVKRTLPNNAGVTNITQKPTDIANFYTLADSLITGRNGDGLGITIEFKVRPTTASVTKITLSIDIGGAIGEIYVRDFILTKGDDIEHHYLSSFDTYTLDTWQANGGKVKIISDNPAEVYNIRYIFTRTHKAR